MGCGDVMTPVLYWATLASGGLLGLGGVMTALTLDPFGIFNGIFSLLFGMMIIGAQLNIEFILSQVAFLKRFWGKGVFFLYVGIPMLKAMWNSIDTPDSGDHAVLIEAVVGVALTVNGLIHLLWAFTGAPAPKEGDASQGADKSLSAPLTTGGE